MLSTRCIIGNQYLLTIIKNVSKVFDNSDFRWVTSIIVTKEDPQIAALTTSNAGRIIQMIW